MLERVTHDILRIFAAVRYRGQQSLTNLYSFQEHKLLSSLRGIIIIGVKLYYKC